MSNMGHRNKLAAIDFTNYPFVVTREVAAADIAADGIDILNPPTPVAPNQLYLNPGAALLLLRTFVAHTAGAATARFRWYCWPSPKKSATGPNDTAFDIGQAKGLMMADVTATYSGSRTDGEHPITRQPTPGVTWWEGSSFAVTILRNADAFRALEDAEVAPVNHVQTLTIAASAGQYKLTFNGQTTANLAFDANAAAIQAALEALSSIGAGNVAVTGTGPFVITFQGTLAGALQPIITVTPGTTPYSGGTITVAHTTFGRSGEHLIVLDGCGQHFMWLEPLTLSAGTKWLAAIKPWL